jgi:hypothetical protein
MPGSTSFNRSHPIYWDETTISNLSFYRLYKGRSTGNYTSSQNMGSGTTGTVTTDQGGWWYFAMTTVNTSSVESGFSAEYVVNIPLPSGMIG